MDSKTNQMTATLKRNTVSWTAFGFCLAVVILTTGIYFYNIIRWKDYPDLGFSLRAATGINVVGVVREHGRNAGIMVGDRILDVNQKAYKSIEELRRSINWKLGEANRWHIEREGHELYINIENIPSGLQRAMVISGLPLFLGICYALIGVLVFLMTSHRRSSWIFLVFSFTFGIFLIFLNPLGKISPLWLENLNIFAYCFTPAVFLHLAVSFPEERRILKRFSLVQVIPYIVSILLFFVIRQTTGVMAYAPKALQIAAVIYMALSVFIFLGSCLQLRITSTSQIVKLRSKMILLGFGISASVPLIDFIANALFKVYILPSFNYYLPFFLAFPAFLGYSIVKHDLFDIDAIIKRTYGYVLTTGALAGIYGLVVLVSNFAFGSYEVSKSPLFPIIFILAVVFLFNPVRDRVQKIIDRLFYRLEYDYQSTVHKISESMRTLLGLDEIGKSILDTAMDTMFIDSGYVMLLRKEHQAYRCLIHAGEKDKGLEKSASVNNGSPISDSKAVKNVQPNPLSGDRTGIPEASEITDRTTTGEKEKCFNLTLETDNPFIRKVAEYQKEVTIYDIQENPFFEDDRRQCLQVFNRLDATLIIPLIHEKNLIGMIGLGRKKSGKFYRREDINLLNILANQGAIAIENALMLEEVIEKERMEEELNIARDLQVSMLPLECPQIEGFEIAAFSESAREVGGDFYDFIDISENRLGIVIGDVTGKSVSGALVMSASRSIFRMLGENQFSVSESMIRANRRTKKDIKSGMFVALLYAVLSSEDRSLNLCSAGQTQPILRSAATGETALVETVGDSFPLGILDDADYQETQLRLDTGDKIVLYTDGIVEAMSGQEELFGFDRLLAVVNDSTSQTAESMLQEIRHHIDEFVGNVAQHDDITIIVIQAK